MARESEVGDEITQTISDWDGRIIVAAVASNLSRIQQVFDAADATGRRVVLTGFDIENIVRTAIRLKKLSLANESLLIKPKDMSRFEDHELIILETGRMGEPINGLRKMSIGRHRYVEIKDGDLVYIVTTPSIAKEAVMARVENMIYQAGGVVKLITQSLRVSGHGNARDLQLMINLLQPKYLFPIQGEYRGLDAHAKAAMEVGILPENILIPKRGSIMSYENGDFVPAGAVSAGDVILMEMPSVMWAISSFVTVRSCQRMESLSWRSTVTVVRRKLWPRPVFIRVDLFTSRRVVIFSVKVQN